MEGFWIDEKFGKVPVGWEIKKLKDVSLSNGEYGANAPALPFQEGSIRYIRITDIDDYGNLINEDKASIENSVALQYLLKDDDILFARTGDTVGKSLLYKETMGKSAFAGYLIKFTLDKSIVVPEYINAVAKSCIFDSFKYAMKRVGAKPNINSREYGSFRFLLPPLSEQTAIAKILSTVDEAIRSTRDTISKLERVKQSLMQNLLSGKMKPDGTLRPADEFYEDEKMGLVPKGWTVIRLKKCLKLKNGKANVTSNLRDFPDTNCNVPVYGGNGITGYYSTPLLNEKTLIIGRVGEYCGNVFLTPEKSWVTDNAMIVDRFLIPNYNLEFFKHKLGSLNFKQWSDSTGQPKITQGGIGAIEFCFPESVEEQILIAQKIASIQLSIDNKQEKITALELLKKSLMQQLLTGKVRVK